MSINMAIWSNKVQFDQHKGQYSHQMWKCGQLRANKVAKYGYMVKLRVNTVTSIGNVVNIRANTVAKYTNRVNISAIMVH